MSAAKRHEGAQRSVLVRVPSVDKLAVTQRALYGRATTRTYCVKKHVRARMTCEKLTVAIAYYVNQERIRR